MVLMNTPRIILGSGKIPEKQFFKVKEMSLNFEILQTKLQMGKGGGGGWGYQGEINLVSREGHGSLNTEI